MGDMGDMWMEHKKENQIRRANNRTKSADMLKDAGIVFESKNADAHLIVEGNNGYIDFWPGTGRWHIRNGKRGFGVQNLINFIQS